MHVLQPGDPFFISFSTLSLKLSIPGDHRDAGVAQQAHLILFSDWISSREQRDVQAAARPAAGQQRPEYFRSRSCRLSSPETLVRAEVGAGERSRADASRRDVPSDIHGRHNILDLKYFRTLLPRWPSGG